MYEVSCLEQGGGGSVNEAERRDEGFGAGHSPFTFAQLLCKFHHPLTGEPSSESLPLPRISIWVSSPRIGVVGRKPPPSIARGSLIDCTTSSPLPFGTITITQKFSSLLGSSLLDYLKRKHPFVMYDNCDHNSVYNVLIVI